MVDITNAEATAANSEHKLSIDDFWNPGPETIRERLKLQALHRTTQAGQIASRFLGRLAKNSIGVLTYHRISPSFEGVEFPTINVTPTSFREQLTGLQDRGFQFVSLDSVLNAQTTGLSLRERTVVLTFDDIYDNVFHQALPVLQELKIPATVFISTAFVNATEPFLFDPWASRNRDQVCESAWRPITDQNLQRLWESGLIEIGAHTHTHQDFRNRPAEFARDVARGISILQSRFDLGRMPFAFPYGSPRMGFCNHALMDAIKSQNLRCGLTTGPHTNRTNSSPFGWGRFHVFEHDTAATLAAKLDGWYEWMPRLKNRLFRKN